MAKEKPTTKDFLKARIEFDDSAQDVADQFGCSRGWIYECLKYPDKDPDLHKQIVDYINSAEKLQAETV